jgi:ABC-type transport system involved in multi-copper enzyme maturation permease subunit
MPAFLEWLLRLLPLNPICMRLVQGGSRRVRHAYIRSGYLAVMIVVLILSLLSGLSAQSASLRDLANRGAEAFTLVSFGQVVLICLLTPIFMAGAIAQEANPRTWDILLTTPLNALQVVLGNLFGRLFFVLALLLSTLPLFSLTQFYGGVPGSAIFLSYAIAACSALMVAAVAVTLSVTRTAGRRAVFVFYTSVVLYLFATYAVDSWLRTPTGVGASSHHTTAITPLNPFLALEALLFSNRYVAHELAGTDASWLARAWFGAPIATFCWLCVLASLALIIFSTARMRVIGTRTGAVPWWRRALRLPPKGSERPARRVGANPIVWREAKAKGGSAGAVIARWSFVALGLLAGLLLLVLFHAAVLDKATLRLALGTLVGAEIVVIILTALNLSAVAVSKEREDGSLDIILTTPIQPGPYLAGKLRGLIQYLLPMIIVPVATLGMVALYVLLNGFGGGPGVVVAGEQLVNSTAKADLPVMLPEVALAMPLVLAPFVAVCVMIGLQRSISTRGTIGSVVGAVAIAVTVAGVLGLCGFVGGREIGTIGAVLVAANPINLLAAGVAPADTIGKTIADGQSARFALLVGAAIAGLAYGFFVYAMHSHMKRTFMFTVRKLAGQN